MNSPRSLLPPALIAALLFAIGYSIVAFTPGGGEVAPEDFLEFYADAGRRSNAFVLGVVLVVGCWAIAWFFSELRAQLPESGLVRAGYTASVIGVTGLAVGCFILLAPVGVQQNSGADFVGVPIAHTFAQAGLGVMLLVGMYSLAVSVAAFSLALRRAELVPGWVGIGGMVLAVLLVGSYIWLPGYLFPVWIVLVAAALRARARV